MKLALTLVKMMKELDRLFDVAFVRPPANSYLRCVSENPSKNSIDLQLAKEQHRTYVSILKESGVEIIELPPLEACPDSVFMQDPALLGSRVSILGRFGEETRRDEAKALVDDLRQHHAVGSLSSVNAPGTLEGGDVLITENRIFVGESKRTNSAGIQQLVQLLKHLDVVGVKTNLMHLLCGGSFLSEGTILIAPDILSPSSFAGFKFVTIPQREAYASDALYLGEGRVLIPSGYPRTVEKLRRAGYRPIEVDLSEFHKGDGGVTCLSSPVYKVF